MNTVEKFICKECIDTLNMCYLCLATEGEHSGHNATLCDNCDKSRDDTSEYA